MHEREIQSALNSTIVKHATRLKAIDHYVLDFHIFVFYSASIISFVLCYQTALLMQYFHDSKTDLCTLLLLTSYDSS